MLWRLRHVGIIGIISISLVLLLEPVALGSPTPLIGRLQPKEMSDLYSSITTISATLTGFLIAAVAILATLDVRRPIVEELRRNESFVLLIINLLAAIGLLLGLTVGGLLGTAQDEWIGNARWFQSYFEILLIASLAELGLGVFYFGIVTYKVGRYP